MSHMSDSNIYIALKLTSSLFWVVLLTTSIPIGTSCATCSNTHMPYTDAFHFTFLYI